MSVAEPLKIVLAGPQRSGKTSLADFIAGHSPELGAPNKSYNPTIGCRILECEKQMGITGGNKVNVELWDVSGDQTFETTWPCVLKDCDGVILVYNPEIPSHEPEVGIWYEQFVKLTGLDDEQCVALVHRTNPAPAPRSRPPPKLSSIQVLNTNFEAANQVISVMEDFFRSCSTIRKKKETALNGSRK